MSAFVPQSKTIPKFNVFSLTTKFSVKLMMSTQGVKKIEKRKVCTFVYKFTTANVIFSGLLTCSSSQLKEKLFHTFLAGTGLKLFAATFYPFQTNTYIIKKANLF